MSQDVWWDSPEIGVGTLLLRTLDNARHCLVLVTGEYVDRWCVLHSDGRTMERMKFRMSAKPSWVRYEVLWSPREKKGGAG